jgi:hypothetical protein
LLHPTPCAAATEARVLAKCALAGLLLGAAYLPFEIVFHESVMRFINNHIAQVFQLTPKKMKIENGDVTEISAFVLNRNVTSVVLLLVPGLLFTAALPARASRRAGIAALIVVAAIATLLSESGTTSPRFGPSAPGRLCSREVRTRCSPSEAPSVHPASNFGRPGCLAWLPLPGAQCCSPSVFQDWRLFRPIKRTRRRAPREKLLYVPQ